VYKREIVVNKKSILTIGIGLAILGVNSSFSAQPEPLLWRFEAYGGFSRLHDCFPKEDDFPKNDDCFPSPGYNVLLTPLPPRDHQDMGAFHWSELSHPSILGINQKEPLIHGQSWKAPGRYYGQKNPIQPGVTSIHGNTLYPIKTGDGMGEVIGWVTHYNNPTELVFDNGRVGVNYHLRLFDPNSDEVVWEGGETSEEGEMSFLIEVWETYNYTQDPECCPDGNPNSEGPNKSGCADRFRVAVLNDFDEDSDIDEDDLLYEDVEFLSPFDKVVGKFNHDGVDYEVSLTGFWENGENGPVLTGEGWSPEYEFIHFEVRAEVNVAGERAAKARTAGSAIDACGKRG
jgi:hypothetical protein